MNQDCQQSELNKFLLYSIDNYKEVITNTSMELVSRFIDVMLSFVRLISQKLLSTKPLHYKFIVERGIDTISHVFELAYCITKNLEVSYYCSQKAFYFYTEFIEQISDDNVSFLKLSSRDATLFVYKKTIYDLNNEYRKQMKAPTQQEQQILDDAHRLIDMYKSMCIFCLSISNVTTLQQREEYIEKCCECIQTIERTLSQKKENYKSKNIENLCLFVNIVSQKNIKIDEYFEEITQFLMSKENVSHIKIAEQLYDKDYD